MDDTQRGTLAAVGGTVFTVGAGGLSALLLADAAPQATLWPNRWFKFGVVLSAILVVAGAGLFIKALNAAQFFRDLGFALIGGAVLGLLVGALARNLDAGLWSGLGFAVLLYTATLPPVRRRLPSPVLERGARSQGIVVRIRPPEAQGKKRLRQETFALVKDIHDYAASKPDSTVESISSHRAMTRAMDGATDESEKNRIWDEYTSQLIRHSEQERRELAQHFGGRVHYLIQEYRRRGMLDKSEAVLLEWKLDSLGWISQAAVEFEALARRL